MLTQPKIPVRLAVTFVALLLNPFLPQIVRAGTFVVANPMTGARYGHTATLLTNGQVLVVGGYSGSEYLSSAERYAPALGTWTNSGSLTTRRVWHTATLLPNGKVLVAGGVNSGGALVSAQLYNPANGAWEPANPLNSARYWHTATLLSNGKVLVLGGVGIMNLSSAELYDPISGTWAVTNAMITARRVHTATPLTNGQVLIAGGAADDGTAIANAELFEPVSGTWTAIDPLATARDTHSASLLPDGRVLVAGGWNGNYRNSAEIYDPGSRSWTPANAMNSARGFHDGILLPDGKVFVVGGQAASPNPVAYNPTAAAEMYDPLGQMWEITSSLKTARQWHTVTPLPDGKVVIVGGQGEIGALTSAELWIPTPSPAPILLTGGAVLAGSGFQFSFTNAPGLSFSVRAADDLTLPTVNWPSLGGVTEVSPGRYQFTDTQTVTEARRFYRVRSP